MKPTTSADNSDFNKISELDKSVLTPEQVKQGIENGYNYGSRIDTITLLRQLNTPLPTVWVSGYHTIGDGAFGSNLFEWDATATEDDNGGTIIKCTSIATGRYKLKFSGAVLLEYFGVRVENIDNSLIINSVINKYDLIDTNIVGIIRIANRIIINRSNVNLKFTKLTSFESTSNIICLQIGDINGVQISNLRIDNINLINQGYGQGNAGLINLNNIKDSELSNINITVDNDNAKVLKAHFNGISTSNDTEDIILRNIHINGTPKSGFHISTKSRRIKIYDCSAKNTGNYNPSIYGYSPGLDIQANDSIVSNFYSYNTAGYGIAIQASRFTDQNNIVWDDTCHNTIIENITIENAQKSGIGTVSFQTGVSPTNVKCKNVNITNSSEQGIIISTSKNITFSEIYIKNSTLSGIYLSSNTEYIHAIFNNITIHNFNIPDTTYNWGVAIGRTDKLYFSNINFIHDAPTINTKAFAGISGKVISYVNINNFAMDGFNSPWHWIAVPLNAIMNYSGLGAPINDAAKTGSTYLRLDGTQNTTFYVNAGGVWYTK